MITEAVILCGGKGTRLNLDIPKALVKVNQRTLLQRQIRYLFANGIEKVVLALGYAAPAIVMEINKDKSLMQKMNLIKPSIEKEPLGTAGAIKLALEKIQGDRFLVCNVDDLVNIPVRAMEAMGDNVMATGNFKCPFGVVKTLGNDIIGFVEKPLLPDIWVSTGFTILKKEDVLPLLPTKGSLEHDVYPKLNFKCYKHRGYWITVNEKKQLEEAEKYFMELEK